MADYVSFKTESTLQNIYKVLNLFSIDGKCRKCNIVIVDSDQETHSNCINLDIEECCICNEQIGISFPLSCGHKFCVDCLIKTPADTCPTCRANIVEVNLLAAKPPRQRPETPELILIENDQSVTMNELTDFIFAELRRGIIVSPRMRISVSPDTQMTNIICAHVSNILQNIPGVIIQINDQQHIVESNNNFDTCEMVALILNIFNSNDIPLQNRLNIFQNIWNIITRAPTTQRNFVMPVEKFGLVVEQDTLLLGPGDIEYKNIASMTINLQDIISLQNTRFKELREKNFAILPAKDAELSQSNKYIADSINDIVFICGLPLLDKIVFDSIAKIIISMISHVIKWYSLEAIKNFNTQIQEQKHFGYSVLSKILNYSSILLIGNSVNIFSLSNKLMEIMREYVFMNELLQ
jgi:hypothetical protein